MRSLLTKAPPRARVRGLGSSWTTRHCRDALPVDTQKLIEDLTRPEAYENPPEEVEFRQTHISLLFFAGARVYKVKKAVDLGFLDFTTLEKRRHYCDEEVRLNRRLAANVYLGAVPITRTAEGRFSFVGDGPAVEWAVEMVRLPERGMFAEMLERGEIDNEQMNSMVSLLARFHADAPTGPGVDEYASPAAIRTNVEQNLEQLSSSVASGILSPAQYAFLKHRRQRFLESRAELLERRVHEGRARDGHGDLHAGNLCLTDDGIVVYDCIEFSRQFRCADVAADVAFLAMDLDQRGYPGFSAYLVKRYAEVADDPDLREVIGFYKGYRAVVRGKVAALTASGSECHARPRPRSSAAKRCAISSSPPRTSSRRRWS